MHLQNLVYLSQCINLAAYNDTIFQEDVMAWDFGPVIPTIYNKLRTYGNGFVSDYIGEYAGKEIFTPKANLVLNKVWDLFVIDCLSKYKMQICTFQTWLKELVRLGIKFLSRAKNIMT
jgi:Uncharacterized phage-associated protein